MDKKVRVSVIIPVYNLQKYIGRCLDSVLSQTFSDFEIIVIDDGSSDDSLRIIQEYSAIYDRVKYIAQNNSGVSKARNKGIEIACGEYLTFVDGDDYIEKDMLEKMYNYANEKGIDVCTSLFISYTDKLAKEEQLIKADKYLQLLFEGKIQRTACAILFRRDLIENFNVRFRHELSYGEDFLFTISAIIKTDKYIGILPDVWYKVEDRAGSAIRTPNINHYDKIKALSQFIYEEIEEFLKNKLILLAYNQYCRNDIYLAFVHIITAEALLEQKISKIKTIREIEHFRRFINLSNSTEISGKEKIKVVFFKYIPIRLLILFYGLKNKKEA